MSFSGNVTGEITASVLPIGAASELVPAGTDGAHSVGRFSPPPSSSPLLTEFPKFLTNQYTVNTTSPAQSTLIMDAQATIQYANEARYGLYKVQTLGPLDVFGEDVIFGTFVASMQSEFRTGRGIVDVWRVLPNGRIDGEAILALLPPGGSG